MTIAIVAVLAGVAPFMSPAAGTAAADSNTTIFDDDFEDHDTTTGLPPGWEYVTSTEFQTIEVTTTTAAQGNQSLHLDNTTTNNWAKIRPKNLPSGNRVTTNVSMSFHKVDATTGTIDLHIGDQIEGKNRIVDVFVADGEGLKYVNSSGNGIVLAKGMGLNEWVDLKVYDINPATNTFSLKAVNSTSTRTWDNLEMYQQMNDEGYNSFRIVANGESYADDVRFDGANVRGQVTDQTGAPAENVTVYSLNYDTANPPQLGTRSLEEVLNEPVPEEWYDQVKNTAGFGDKTVNTDNAEFDDTRVLMHSADQWKLHGHIQPGDRYLLANANLDPPKTVIDADSEIAFSCWNFNVRYRDLILQDEIASEIDGVKHGTCDTITVDELDPLNDTVDSTTYTPRAEVVVGIQTFESTSTTYEIASPDLSPGVYRVYPDDDRSRAVIYVVAPNRDVSQLEGKIENLVKGKIENRSEFNKRMQELYSDGEIGAKSTTTNETGHYGLVMNSQVIDEAEIRAVAPGAKMNISERELSPEDLRTEYENAVESNFRELTALDKAPREYRRDQGEEAFRDVCRRMDSVMDDVGSPFYGETTTTVPNRNANIHGQRLIPPGIDQTIRECAAINIAEQIAQDPLSLLPGFTGDLNDYTRDELEALYRKLIGYIEGTPALEDALDAETSQDIDTILNDDPSELSRSTLESRISDGMETVDSGGLQSGGGGGGINVGGGGGSPTVSVPDSSTGDETLNAVWQVGGVDDWNDADLLVRLHYSNGSTTILDGSSEYVSVDESAVGSDTVRLKDYPLGSTDPATVRVELDVATPDGSAGDPDTGESIVRNPTFDGEIPELRDMRVSTFAPGPNDNVSVSVTPEDAARFGKLEYANVSHPACSYSVTPTDGELDLWTCGEGAHHVSVTFSNPGGTHFTETFRLPAKATTQSRPATVRSKVGPVGRYAVANGQLAGGDIQTHDGASVVEVIAIAEPGNIPNSIVASTTGMDVAKDSDTVVRVVEGDAQQTVRKRVGVLLHRDSPSDDALLYRNGKAIPKDGEATSARVNTSGGALTIDTFTNEQGEVTLRVNGDPGYLDRIRHWVSLNVPVLSLSLGGDLLLFLTPLVVIGRRRRKRPPNSGSQGGEAAA